MTKRLGSGPQRFSHEAFRLRTLLNQYRVELFLGLLVLAIIGPVVQKDAAQQASRYALTAAVVEEHTVELDDYAQVLGVDKAVYQGHIYSDKAPGQPLLAIPFYALYRWVGGESGTVLRVDGNLGLWWLTFWFSMLPAAGLAVLMYRFALRTAPETALPAALGIALGTMLLPFSALLFGHVLAAFLGFSAFLVVSRDVSSRRLAVAGVLVGLAVTVEYTMAIVAVALGVYVVWRARARTGWYVLGGVPFAFGLAAYNWLVFGSPTVLSYQLSAFGGVVEAPRAVGSILSSIHPVRLVEVFFAPRGFLAATPLVLVGLAGVVLLMRRRHLRSEGLLVAGVFVGFLLIPLMWGNAWGGDSPGPRYMLPALPFLAAPLALMWRRVPLVSMLAFVIGVATMGLATFTDPLIRREIVYPVGTWLSLAWHGEWVTTLFTMWLGAWGRVLQGSLAILVALVLRRSSRRSSSEIV